MNFQIPDFVPAIPEIFVLSMACLILVIDLFVKQENRFFTYLLSQLTLVVAAVLTLYVFSGKEIFTFENMFVSDNMSSVLKIFIYLITSICFLYSRKYLIEQKFFRGEFFVLGLFGVLGMMIMVSAHSFLTVYLGLELLSLSLYAMVALRRDSIPASEAAMKYFVLGAIASGMLLYGMSILYGAAGTLDLGEIASYLSGQHGEMDVITAFGLVFIVVGLAFKLGAVPFHMWIPDVYHGAPTPVTLYLGTAPKIAAFAMAMRLLVDGLQPLHGQWQDMLIILAILSMAIGNIVAIAQTNLKRMLAYSTIAHIGFLLLGIQTGNSEGYSASMFYIIVYSLMSLGGFGMIILLSRTGFEADKIEDFKGLNDRNPWYAFIMLVLMFSMAGVPPTLGFYAKLSIIQSLISVEMVWLAVIAVLFSIIGAFYYLRIIKTMYFEKAIDTTPIHSNFDMRVVISINGLAILALGLYPSALMNLCIASI
ncbi:MAG: NADH-quinone oxidoreductase subunit NuoN [Gammaproteobacteria bacterium]|nr:NADH-quinone oxidoreductase subunit NuoN [Gammaproteobacteria bacterium]